MLLILASAAALRFAYLASTPATAFFAGGDGPWYLEQARLIARGELPHPLTTAGPLYPLFLAAIWLLFPAASAAGSAPPALLTTARLAQIALSVLMVWAGYQLARTHTGQHAPAMVTAMGLGWGPAFVLAPMYILTEPLLLPILTLAGLLYTRAQASRSPLRVLPAGLALGLAGLTRPVFLLLPLLLVPHLLWSSGGRGGVARSTLFLSAFALVVLPWTAYLAISVGRPWPDGFGSNLWIGSVGEGRWEGFQRVDVLRQGLGDDGSSYVAEALRRIADDPAAWLRLRARNLIEALAVPYGTADLAGPGIKAMFGEWLRQDRTIGGLRELARAPALGWKMLTYLFHGAAVALTAVGLWSLRGRWLEAYFVVMIVVYLVAVHAVLTIVPRYLFPAEPFLWVLAAVGAQVLLRRGGRSI